jgi:hypothetical protein
VTPPPAAPPASIPSRQRHHQPHHQRWCQVGQQPAAEVIRQRAQGRGLVACWIVLAKARPWAEQPPPQPKGTPSPRHRRQSQIGSLLKRMCRREEQEHRIIVSVCHSCSVHKCGVKGKAEGTESKRVSWALVRRSEARESQGPCAQPAHRNTRRKLGSEKKHYKNSPKRGKCGGGGPGAACAVGTGAQQPPPRAFPGAPGHSLVFARKAVHEGNRTK